MTGISYVLPLRWVRGEHDAAEMTRYLADTARRAQVIVVDGSPAPVFEENAARWGSVVRHVAPDPRLRCLNGKVQGVLTGLQAAAHERVVVADDDVRYDAGSLEAVAAMLDEADLVVPQNYFDPLPWHAMWDTSRTLLNRACGHDFPGTLAVRRSSFFATGGYDGDVLFENLELMRSIRAAGGRVRTPLDLYVRRLPPSWSRFAGQRVRQAYDEFARPHRLLAFLAAAPAAGILAARGRKKALLAAAAAAVVVAERGRRRAGGARFFPAAASLFAPAWIAERAIASWIALGRRVLFGGCSYAGVVITRSATPPRTLARRAAASAAPSGVPAGPGSRPRLNWARTLSRCSGNGRDAGVRRGLRPGVRPGIRPGVRPGIRPGVRPGIR